MARFTYALRRFYDRVPIDWELMPHGICRTNIMANALEERDLIEMRVKEHHPWGFSKWEWRRRIASKKNN